MKKSIRFAALLLALTCLWGCAKTVETSPTETTPTQPEPAPINTEELLVAALEQEARVMITGDIAMTKGAVVKGNLLDGGGHTLTAPVYDEADIYSACGLFITKGSIENVTVKGGHRGIGTNKENRVSDEVRIKNVELDGENCGLYIAHGDKKSMLYVDNSRLGSQTVFAQVGGANFTNCTFHWNASGTKGNMTAYTNVTISDCHFENLVLDDGTVKLYTLQFPSKYDGLTMTLQDCYVGDTLITPENISSLLNVKPRNSTIQVRNTGR